MSSAQLKSKMQVADVKAFVCRISRLRILPHSNYNSLVYLSLALTYADGALNLRRAMILFVAAGELVEALATLRNAKQPDTAAMFLLACHEAKVIAKASVADKKEAETGSEDYFDLPGDLSHHQDEVQAVCEYYGEYQRHLAHACTGIGAVVD